MSNKLRRHPLTCLVISIYRLLIGKLIFSKQFIGETVKMDKKSNYQNFRHITNKHVASDNKSIVFIVSFKFSSLSHKANKLASIIPMLLITGFPGFEKKIYAVNHENGYWQGMYQWKTKKHLDDYLNSFVYKMMNKRALKETISSRKYDDQLLNNFIDNNKI